MSLCILSDFTNAFLYFSIYQYKIIRGTISQIFFIQYQTK